LKPIAKQSGLSKSSANVQLSFLKIKHFAKYFFAIYYNWLIINKKIAQLYE